MESAEQRHTRVVIVGLLSRRDRRRPGHLVAPQHLCRSRVVECAVQEQLQGCLVLAELEQREGREKRVSSSQLHGSACEVRRSRPLTRVEIHGRALPCGRAHIVTLILELVANRQRLGEPPRFVQRQREVAEPPHVRARRVITPVARSRDASRKELPSQDDGRPEILDCLVELLPL